MDRGRTICLLTAAFMVLTIPLAIDVVFAKLWFMVEAKWEGHPLWRTFWVGDTLKTALHHDVPGRDCSCVGV